MMNKPIILIDMDGVLADFDRGCLEKMKELFPKFIIMIDKSSMYHISEEYALRDETFKKIMDSIIKSPGFYENLPLIENAQGILNSLEFDGYEVFICTSPPRETENINGKYIWIEKNFGPKWRKKIIMTHDKTLIHGDILIDDKPKITGAIEPSFTHILFDQPYNRNENKPRITQWKDSKDWKEVIESVLLSKKSLDDIVVLTDPYIETDHAFKKYW
jgi:5'-nucleotidase